MVKRGPRGSGGHLSTYWSGPRLTIKLRKLCTQMANNLLLIVYRMLLSPIESPTDMTTLVVTLVHRVARACHSGGVRDLW